MFRHPCMSLVSMGVFFSLLLYVVSDSTLLTSKSVTCKYGNLFFLCFYGWLVTVLRRLGNLFFPCLYVWQVLLSDVTKDVEASYYVWEFSFPVCSIGTHFSSTLERTCISLFLCGNLFSLNVAYKFIFPLLYVVKDVETSCVQKLMFPRCSLRIYFFLCSSDYAIYLNRCCMSLI
jgi:hypothetical protein